ncbi:MAG: Asp-tRNA(Asn)/Glu-tRNA(Gln) amidotransferase subunit GatB [Sedimentisphaerales bacterium]|nr:Asp-tRNA(Asn)/Glu-tRNA(Gln) amidotransferase subunit GatB [Sedimentisphaerales bacterium]MBN2841734.1 Asp-tRNA(Asn)/Glu-tRNA(Gln) amidotransferase subunit GatB [Sedimentisphaerales bacterium]
MEVKLVVGMEIHVQLACNTKMFCGCRLGYGDAPNSNVCPVCLGLPGSLPVINKQAFEHSVRTALALNLNIAEFTKWDRKGYYYPDLPKNYQISQYDLPFSYDGYIDLPLADGTAHRVRINRAHLEEDAGKNQHEGLPHSQIDLNRAGTPLLEIVTEPDLNSPEQCRVLAQELQKIVQFVGASHANMQLGQMRFEPNINLQITMDGKVYKTPIVEVKNLNSFRAVEGAVAYEAWRQLEEFKKDHSFTRENHGKQNRGWDDAKGETIFQREKEESSDYRYFPDPDLVPVKVDAGWLKNIRDNMPEMPLAMKARFVNELGLKEYDASVLTAEAPMARYFDAAVKAGGPAKRLANIITQFGISTASEKSCAIDELGITPQRLAELAKLVEDGTINATASAKLFNIMLTDDAPAAELAEKHSLIQKSDSGEIEKLVDEVLAANAKAVEDVRSGSKKAGAARGFLMGQVMQRSKGQANPKVVSELLAKKLS